MVVFDPVLAKPEQAKEIQALVNQGYGHEITRIPGSLRYPKIEEVTALIQNTCWMIVQDPVRSNKIIGSLMLEVDEERHHKINALAVDPSYSGKGLGKTLLRSAEKILAETGVTEVFLEVISIANHPLDDCQGFTKKRRIISSEKDSLAKYYQKLGFDFTDNAIFTPYEWQAECRKTEYMTRVYFREMRKKLSST
jgi:ribosomal protein S18 acetylase RimI-like enzyme